MIIHDFLIKTYENIQKMENQAVRKEYLKKFDFASSAIHYCKIVELMLNDHHKALYDDCFRDMPYDKNRTFGEDKEKDFTIGNFTHMIYCHPKSNYYQKKEKSENRTLLAKKTKKPLSEWEKHAEKLEIIRQIRNQAAHDTTPLDYDTFMKLIHTMFRNGEFLRIWDLTHESN